MNVIECKNLTHYYGRRCIYENLNLNIEQGKVVGLLGKNGTGKTTTINILNGFLTPHSGECRIFGEDSHRLSAKTKQRIGLLLEGHVQYSFMNIKQIENYYSKFYTKWNSKVYFELMDMLKIKPEQKISKMSCGQRSQVALGLILAQDPDLFILDDFSMGLDPGYRRLFVEYLNEYVKSKDKTVFVSSHIIQDMEMLIDECVIMDYGKILKQEPVDQFLDTFLKFTLQGDFVNQLKQFNKLYSVEFINGKTEFYSSETSSDIISCLGSQNIDFNLIKQEKLSLEDAFIGLTGKY
ncbi:MAG: ABC transporter ATP-binding protein [Marinifilaceae bacterium]|jgi:ABC-2 type transport system ATP-binding protein|nr:ABC transporter ATP-binding protein [Marinifilaceae bacterium]